MDRIDNTQCNVSFGAFIKRARLEKGLFQEAVARELGISQGYYAHIEAGRRNVDLSVALNICRIIGIDINEFLEQYKI